MNADERGWVEDSALVRSRQRPINRELFTELWPFYGLALADVLLGRLDILLLSLVAGDVVTGIYSAAYNVVRVPAKLIQSYWQALYPTLSRLIRADYPAYLRLVKLSIGAGLLLTLVGVGLINLLAAPLLNLLYQEGLADIQPIFRVLTVSIPILLIEIGCLTLLMAAERARSALTIMGVHLGCIAISLPILVHFYGGVGAAYGVLLAAVVGGGFAVIIVVTLQENRI